MPPIRRPTQRTQPTGPRLARQRLPRQLSSSSTRSSSSRCDAIVAAEAAIGLQSFAGGHYNLGSREVSTGWRSSRQRSRDAPRRAYARIREGDREFLEDIGDGVRTTGLGGTCPSARGSLRACGMPEQIELHVNGRRVVVRADPGTPLLTVLRNDCLLYTSPSPRDRQKSRLPSSA